MTIKIKRVDGATEIFETGRFIIAPGKDTHPNIVEITVFSNSGKKLKHWGRRFQRRYMKTHEFIVEKPKEEAPTES